jgi:hypothetical protein
MNKHITFFATVLLISWLSACNSQDSLLSPSPTIDLSPVFAPTDPPVEAIVTTQPTAWQEVSDVEIKLERWGCYGECPVYEITISGNGTVVYRGYRYVMLEGEQVDLISQQLVEDLLEDFEEIDFYSLPDYTSSPATDMPKTSLSLSIAGNAKTLRHNYGDRNAPKELSALERKIDVVVNSRRWIGDSGFELWHSFP